MRFTKSAAATACLVLATLGPPSAARAGDGDPVATAAHDAVYGDTGARRKAIKLLRNQGPSGLQVLARQHAALLDQLRGVPAPQIQQAQTNAVASEAGRPPRLAAQRLQEALDQVAQQRGAANSLLYWYTNLEAAKAAARRLNQPILSLRLLGRLTDEYSCANSRFFRTVLYANRDVSDTLRENFVLHWSSERPVPVVTIDYGDGRVLRRTLTGNSAHYALDHNGRPVDVLPGLYGPRAFLRGLGDAAAIAADVASLSDIDAQRRLQVHHRQRLSASLAAWKSDLARAGSGTSLTAIGPAGMPNDGRPGVVLPQLNVLSLTAATTDQAWTRIATLRADDARLDDASRRLIRREQPLAPQGPPAPDAMRVAVAKMAAEDPLLRIVMQFERDIAKDTVRNEYRLHSLAHEWFAAGAVGSLAELNRRVYNELFLTPSADPWMGLAPAVYTGLDGAGVAFSAPH